MKTNQAITFLVLSTALIAPAADTALSMNSTAIRAWASGIKNISYGSYVSTNFKTPHKALGHATGDSFDIVCLGRGGQITLTFPQGISNGPGYDFAIFENGFQQADGDFLELAWVEVSSDGDHFVRFRNQSQSDNTAVGAFEGMSPNEITGLASKYTSGLGTQFDLDHMRELYDYVSNGTGPALSISYKNHLLTNYPHLNLDNIQYVRLIDIVGDGSAKDAYDKAIYDPYPTIGSAGFDLDAIAVLNEGSITVDPPNTFVNWAFNHRLSGSETQDADLDGASDLEEYFLGSNPTNAADRASVSGMARSNRFEIIFNRDPEALGNIDVEAVDSLLSTSWNLATIESVSSNGPAITVALPIETNQCFYRLRFEGGSE